MLDAPHSQIVATGQAIQDKCGGAGGVVLMLRTRVDPDINYFSLDYMAMANSNFLGIWEAAEGEEFVIGSNSFGLWEGIMGGIGDMHRVFVVSPRIALILRQCIVSTAEEIQHIKARASVTSLLIDIPMNQATSTYANFNQPSWTTPDEQAAATGALWKYRRTPAAQEDTFTFKPTRLTREQTYALNHIILLGVSDGGNVTSASPSAMIKTLKYHLNATHPAARESKYWFRGLLGTLSAVPMDPTSSAQVHKSGIEIVLQAIANGTVEFRSAYDRAYKVYHATTDDIAKYNQASSDIHQMTARAILKMKNILPPPPIIHRHQYFPFLCRDIVKQLPKEESELFFALVGYQVDVLEVGPASNNIMDQIKYEAAIIGFTHWLAENRSMMLYERLSPWVKVVL